VKKVWQLSELTPGLDAFLQSYPEGTWNEFRDFEGGTAVKELVQTLMDKQRGLCAYCEINLLDSDREIEHFHPKHDDRQGANYWTFQLSNLFAACRGGSYPHSGDSSRSLPPIRQNLSYGAKKADKILDDIIVSPASLSVAPSVFSVSSSGEIKVDSDNCQITNTNEERVIATISALNLNCQRLRNARAAVWQQLEDYFQQDAEDGQTDQEVLRQIASIYLLPDDDGKLSAFFTTIRAFCGAIGEELLAESPDVWL
jgi:uncharacterized protein (TIGR02646 family)